ISLGIKAEKIPVLFHVWRQRRGYIDYSTAGMWYGDTARQEMQLVLHTPDRLPVLDIEIFRVTNDRIANMRQMRAQLMSPAGHRLERNPCHLLSRSFDDRIVRDGMNGIFFPVLGDAHETFFLDFLLGEEGRDAALLGLRHARNEGPIYLASGT